MGETRFHSACQGTRQGNSGLEANVTEALLLATPWPVRVEDIAVARIFLWRGEQDRIMPVVYLDNKYMTVHQARELLHISRYKMSRLIGEGVLETKEYMLDRRVKLVRRTDVEKLAASMQRLKNGVAPL